MFGAPFFCTIANMITFIIKEWQPRDKQGNRRQRVATKEKESEEAQCSEAKETKRSDTKEAKGSESEEVECSGSKESEQEIIAKKAD